VRIVRRGRRRKRREEDKGGRIIGRRSWEPVKQ